MSDFRVIVTVPVEQAAVASAVGRAMDIDVGGADSFVERDGKLVAQTWASKAFAHMFQYLIASPHGLHMAVASDYESRWPELVPPDLTAIEAFCQSAVLITDSGGNE